eukprot:scaffold359212_cov34-Prasinocladus_malaysianus.AAC.1
MQLIICFGDSRQVVDHLCTAFLDLTTPCAVENNSKWFKWMENNFVQKFGDKTLIECISNDAIRSEWLPGAGKYMATQTIVDFMSQLIVRSTVRAEKAVETIVPGIPGDVLLWTISDLVKVHGLDVFQLFPASMINIRNRTDLVVQSYGHPSYTANDFEARIIILRSHLGFTYEERFEDCVRILAPGHCGKESNMPSIYVSSA